MGARVVEGTDGPVDVLQAEEAAPMKLDGEEVTGRLEPGHVPRVLPRAAEDALLLAFEQGAVGVAGSIEGALGCGGHGRYLLVGQW